jgi:hypothetical protein
MTGQSTKNSVQSTKSRIQSTNRNSINENDCSINEKHCSINEIHIPIHETIYFSPDLNECTAPILGRLLIKNWRQCGFFPSTVVLDVEIVPGTHTII